MSYVIIIFLSMWLVVVYLNVQILYLQVNPCPQPHAPDSQEFSLRANLLSTPHSQAIQDLLHEFSHVNYFDRLTPAHPCHDVSHHILTNPGPPVFAKPCHLDPEKLASTMEKAGIIRRYNSPLSSPLHMV